MSEIKCVCGKTYKDSDYNQYSDWLRCECGEQVYKQDRSAFGILNRNIDSLDFMDPRYVEARRKQCGVEI